MDRSHIADMLAYHRWADERVIAACSALSADDYAGPFDGGWPSVRSALVHLAAAGRAWTSRLEGSTVTSLLREADLPGFDDATTLLRASHDRLDSLLAQFSDDDLATPWTYTTTTGTALRLRKGYAFLHVVNHGTYHRGQIANKLARRGITPPVTDLAFWEANRAN